jgi:hypothetical protein
MEVVKMNLPIQDIGITFICDVEFFFVHKSYFSRAIISLFDKL